jgi:hypothetical protein
MSLFSKSEYPDVKISAYEFWKTHLMNHFRKDLSSYPKLRDYNFYANENATMSGKTRITYYYTIDGYPTETPIDFRSDIRDMARGDVRVSFISTFEPTNIDWNSPQLRSKIKTWKSVEEDSEEVNSYNYYKYATALSSRSRRKSSLIYLRDAQLRKRNLFKYRTMMVVSGFRGESFDKSIYDILDYCKSKDFQVTRIEQSLGEFLRAFSPFSAQFTSKVLKQVGNNTIPDEQIARFSTYSQGKIGKTGIMFGTDIHSGFAVFKQVKKSDVDAENILITAETGGGKSYFAKYLILQLISYDYFNGTINDIEGSEYLPFANYLSHNDKVVVLNMAEGQGCYYDPFEISLTGVDKLDKDLFTFCKSFTNTIFRVLIGETLLDSNVWAQKIVNNAIALAYSSIGVDENDKSTWGNTKGYDLFYVYSKFKDLYKECIELQKSDKVLELYDMYKVNPEYKNTLDKVVAKLSEYFEPFEHGGIRSDVFRNRVSLSDIVDAKLLINSFGMEGRSADTIDKTQMTLSQISAANISYIRSIFSKAQGKFNFKVWEEFQRWGQFPGSAVTIKTAITGGRKLGDVNFIITNNVKELLDDDRFAIFDNITSFALGAIASQSTRRRLCEELSVANLQGELDSIVSKKGNPESFETNNILQSKYDKAFLVGLDKTIFTIAKAELPSHIASSKIFKTGVEIKK